MDILKQIPIKRAYDLAEEVIDDEVLIYDSKNGTSQLLNSTAGIIWLLIDGELNTQGIIDYIVESIEGVERDQITNDVVDTLKKFDEINIIEFA